MKKRFGEIEMGELFFYAKKKMKKLDAYNAVTVVDKGKEHFMFFKHNLVEEFVEAKEEKTVVGKKVDPNLFNSFVDLFHECHEEQNKIIEEKKIISSKFDLPLLNIVTKNSKFEESSKILNAIIPFKVSSVYDVTDGDICPVSEKDIFQLQSIGNRGIRNSKALQDELDYSFL